MSKTFPSTLRSDFKSNISRRGFIRQMIVVGIALNVPFYHSCKESSQDSILTQNQEYILRRILEILFPQDDMGPSIVELKIYDYILWVLTDARLDPDEAKYTIRGIAWINESSQEELEMDFDNLNAEQQEFIIKFVSETSWGESWLSTLLTLIFEALLLDPIYNVNEQRMGWKWLNHQEGSPRPEVHNAYPTILKRKKEKGVITNLNQL